MLSTSITAYDSRIAQMFRNLRGLGVHSILPAAFVTHRRWYLAGGGVVDTGTELVDGDGGYLVSDKTLVKNTANQLVTSRANLFGSPGVGILVEQQGINLLPAIQNFASGSWIKDRTDITSNATIAPDGTLTADKCIPTVALGAHQIRRSEAFDGSSVYTWTCFAKKAELDNLQLKLPAQAFPSAPSVSFNLTLGTATPGGGATGDIVALPNGWFFCIMQATSDVATTNLVIHRISPDGGNNGTDGLFLWNTHLQASNFATNPIMVSDATRIAGNLQWPNTGEQLFQANQGTCIVVVVSEASGTDLSVPATIIDTRVAGAVDGWFLRVLDSSNDFQFEVRSGGSTSSSIVSGLVPSRGIPDVIVLVWQLNEFRMYLNGVLMGSDLIGPAPTVLNANVFVGQSEAITRPFPGIIGPVVGFNRALTLKQSNSVVHREIAPIYPGRLRMLA